MQATEDRISDRIFGSSIYLVKNAIEAMRSAPTEKRRLRLATGLHEKSGVAVYVHDSGTGILRRTGVKYSIRFSQPHQPVWD
jgi:hypothetical protein